MTIKILNLYAGIGGNRKLWTGDIEVTAVEIDPKIAEIYKSFFPNDKVIVADAHQYLIDHYDEFDFIWSSPPCPTHSRFNNLHNNCEEKEKRYPDMKLYEEIIFLKHFFKGKFCVENVISYYDPLIEPQQSGNHYFWCNFLINKKKSEQRMIRRDNKNIEPKILKTGFDVSKFDIPKTFQTVILNNLVNSELCLHIFECAFKEK